MICKEKRCFFNFNYCDLKLIWNWCISVGGATVPDEPVRFQNILASQFWPNFGEGKLREGLKWRRVEALRGNPLPLISETKANNVYFFGWQKKKPQQEGNNVSQWVFIRSGFNDKLFTMSDGKDDRYAEKLFCACAILYMLLYIF